MTETQNEILEKKFRDYEKKSSILVLLLFSTIILIHLIDPFGEIQQLYVKYIFRFSLILVLAFIVLEFLKELIFPVIAKFYFKDENDN